MPAELRPLPDGWYAWVDPANADTDVRVRVGEGEGGRPVITAIHVEGDVSAGLLRSVPIGRIAAAAAGLRVGAAAPAARRKVSARVPSALRSNAVRGYPDAFYDFVAVTYRSLAVSSARPIVELAEANDVPVTTAQRWVKEARRRGLLAPGHPGKAG